MKRKKVALYIAAKFGNVELIITNWNQIVSSISDFSIKKEDTGLPVPPCEKKSRDC